MLNKPLAVVFFAALLSSASATWGHPQFALSTVNRYGKVVLGEPLGAPVKAAARQRPLARLFYTLMVGDVPAYALRKQADTNADGRLDESEQAALGRRLLAAVQDGLSLELDGKPLPLLFDAPLLQLTSPQVSPQAFACELTAKLGDSATDDKAGQPRVLRYDDRVALDPVGDVELRIEEGPGTRLLASWQGKEPGSAGQPGAPPNMTPPNTTPPNTTFVSQGPPRSLLSDRSISLRFMQARPALAAKKGPWGRLWILGLVIFVACAVGIGRGVSKSLRSGASPRRAA